MGWWVVAGVLFAVWVAMNAKTSRPDGRYMGRIHPYRRMMQFLMPAKYESLVYFDDDVRADALLAYLKEARDRFGADITHALVAGLFVGLAENPAMNRFAVGRRLYRRNGRFITFSMKRKQLDKKAKLATVKMELEAGETFRELVERINGEINRERSGEKTYTDKELDLFLNLPRPILLRSVQLLKWLDYHNLLPGFFIKGDPMYTSIFLANLGSLGMRAGYHHLYEWGTCPLFIMAGRIEERPVVEDGQVVMRPFLPLRFTYDERIDDGLTAGHGIRTVLEVLASPYERLGCLAEDGSDARPLDAGAKPDED